MSSKRKVSLRLDALALIALALILVGTVIVANRCTLFLCSGCCEEPTFEPVVLGLEDGCPDDWDDVRMVFADREVVNVGEQLGIAEQELGLPFHGPEAPHNIPESNDCQRFLVGDPTPGARFDSLFAIFALAPESLVERLEINSGLPVLAAQIWTFDQAYEELAIEPWFNCLYLWRGDHGWEAAVLPRGQKEAPCAVQLDSIPASQQLVVLDTAHQDPTAAYPRAARWEWDPAALGYRIGIPCGLAWCEITMGGGSVAAIEDAQSYVDRKHESVLGDDDRPWSGEQLMRAQIKGWYDEQILDVYTDGRLVSSGIRGWVFPDSAIGQHDTTTYEDGWIRSALVFLDPLFDDVSAGLAKYEKMFNFGHTDDWLNPNVVSFCKPVSGDCGAPDELAECQQKVGLDTWLAKIYNPQRRTEEIRCVARCDHSPGYVPGTARWRGVEYDAKMWTRCAEGCCTIQ